MQIQENAGLIIVQLFKAWRSYIDDRLVRLYCTGRQLIKTFSLWADLRETWLELVNIDITLKYVYLLLNIAQLLPIQK